MNNIIHCVSVWAIMNTFVLRVCWSMNNVRTLCFWAEYTICDRKCENSTKRALISIFAY